MSSFLTGTREVYSCGGLSRHTHLLALVFLTAHCNPPRPLPSCRLLLLQEIAFSKSHYLAKSHSYNATSSLPQLIWSQVVHIPSIQEHPQDGKSVVGSRVGTTAQIFQAERKLLVDLAKCLWFNNSTILNEPFKGNTLVHEKLGQIKITEII